MTKYCSFSSPNLILDNVSCHVWDRNSKYTQRLAYFSTSWRAKYKALACAVRGLLLHASVRHGPAQADFSFSVLYRVYIAYIARDIVYIGVYLAYRV